METIASRGLIVIAPFGPKDNKTICRIKQITDLEHAMRKSKKGGAALHPALATADWNRTGIYGLSIGAKYVLPTANKYGDKLKVKAVLAVGGVPFTQYDDIGVPAMFVTGSLDKGNSGDAITKYFDAFNSTEKIYASLNGAYRMETQEGRRLNSLMANFLACHVRLSKPDCDLIYGNSTKSLCNLNEYERCEVQGNSPTASSVIV